MLLTIMLPKNISALLHANAVLQLIILALFLDVTELFYDDKDFYFAIFVPADL